MRPPGFLFFLICFQYTALAQSITITPLRNLDFDYILPGVNKYIPENSTAAGKLIISGEENRIISISLNAEDYLSSGSASLPITYNASISDNVNDTEPGTGFNPKSGIQHTLPAVTGTCYVRIGGTVMPVFSQQQGDYSATIIILIQYTDN